MLLQPVLCSFSGVSKRYVSIDSDEVYLKQINFLSPVPATLSLTVGAQVMLAKNVDVSQGLVNGARGVVVGFEKGGEGTWEPKQSTPDIYTVCKIVILLDMFLLLLGVIANLRLTFAHLIKLKLRLIVV